MRTSNHTVSKALATSRKTTPLPSSRQSSWTLSTWLVSCSTMLCLDLKLNAHCAVACARLLRRGSWRVGSFRKVCQSFLTHLWVDTSRAAPGFRRESTRAFFQPAGSTGFKKSRWITRPGGIRHLVENASRPYSVYCLEVVLCRLWDPEWRFEYPRGW